MHTPSFTKPLPPLEQLLPPRSGEFENLCRRAQQDPRLKGLVFESLLHGPLGLLVDRRFLPSSEAGAWQRLPTEQFVPMAMRHPKHGIEEFSWVVYSNPDYWFELPGQQGEWAGQFTFASGMDALRVLIQPECSIYPVVVDPTWRHSVSLSPGEVRTFLQAWHAAPAWPPKQFGSCEIGAASSAMRTRLREFLSHLSVEEACVWQCAAWEQPQHMLPTLFVRGADDATLARIGKALPLLNWGLPADEAIAWVVPASDGQLLLPPVYSVYSRG